MASCESSVCDCVHCSLPTTYYLPTTYLLPSPHHLLRRRCHRRIIYCSLFPGPPGTLWTSSLFPGRCPPEYNLLLNYIGGSRDAGLVELSDAEIIAEVDKGCRQVG